MNGGILMGILDDIFEGVKNHNEEAQEAYEEGMRMSPDELRRAVRNSGGNAAKHSGYMKAAKQRGLIRN